MANPEHVERLRFDISQWNDWRRANRDAKIDLSGADLGGYDLSKALLSKADLSKANLNGARLKRAGLGSADLSETSLVEADLTECQLPNANLRFATLERATLNRADLSSTNLERANLKSTAATNSSFDGAKLLGANCAQARLLHASFYRANLCSSILDGADLTGARLFHADLFGASLCGANLTSANLCHTNAGRADLKNADLTGCAVYGLSISDARLDGAIEYDLIVTGLQETEVRVDGLALGQVWQLLREAKSLPRYFNTIGFDAVMMLGPFGVTNDGVVEAIRQGVRAQGLSSIWCSLAPPKEDVPIVSNRPVVFRPYDPGGLYQTLAAVTSTVRLVLIDGHDEAATNAIPFLIRPGSARFVLLVNATKGSPLGRVGREFEQTELVYADTSHLGALLQPYLAPR